MNILRVYLSLSTELRLEGEAVKSALEAIGVSVITIETMLIDVTTSFQDAIQKQIENTDGFIQLVGFNNGCPVPFFETGLEFEGKLALSLGKSVFLFIASDNYLHRDLPPERLDSSRRYKDFLRNQGCISHQFESCEDLISKIYSLGIGNFIRKGRESIGFRIFISYRRQEPISLCVAHRLHEKLAEEFGFNNIFLDSHSIPLGTDYRAHLDSSVANANFMCAVIGPNWLSTLRERQGQDAPDYVRHEICSAIKLKIPVAPIQLADTRAPIEAELPPDMKFLAVSQGFRIRVGHELYIDIDALISKLKHLVEEANKTVVATAGNVPSSLRSGTSTSAVPHL